MITRNARINEWIDECAKLTCPDSVVLIDGSDAQRDALRAEACSTGELLKLNQDLLPGCYLHRSAVNDVARVEDRTFICTRTKAEAGKINNWMDPDECRARLTRLFRGSMKGRTMYVIPYSMGIPGSRFAKYGVELTDSIYVVLSMLIMTRVGTQVLDCIEGDGFTKGLHSKADLDENERYIAHFPETNTIWSVNSGYGGNVLLSKKCLGLRLASYLGRTEGWMAEHMLILEVEAPDGHKTYVCAAFPSSCGKTNLAMLIPPEKYRKLGYKVRTLGDDISWLRVGGDGRLWAINPEHGFFGVAPGTGSRSNPNALATVDRETIFTNVCLDADKGTVWWEGHDDPPPVHAVDWKGRPWTPDMYDKRDKAGTSAAHPNSRFTAPIENCPSLSPAYFEPEGVPISAIIFGGRRAHTAPLVYQTYGWRHGTFAGSAIASETTAATTGAVGVVRRDPMAMRPFVGYDMGLYWQHWLDIGRRLSNPPKIFHVNWFRTDAEGRFMWPGYGENMRVLEWILARCEGKGDAVSTPIGLVPPEDGIDASGLDLAPGTMKELLSVDTAAWLRDCADLRDFYSFIGNTVPDELCRELDGLERRLHAAAGGKDS
jgi:phosphoenolpyruvate carboxykinase (GTP)